jgi:DNA polymerase family A
MKTVTIDFETYWSTTFSLTKMSFIEYVKSPDFEIISCAIKVGSDETKVVFGQQQVIEALQAIDWSEHACIAHNGNEFDFPVLVWVCDCHPAMFVDTLCLSKAKHQSDAGGSLKALSEFYNLPAKDNATLLSTKGKRYAEFDLNEMRDMARYNRVDTDNTYALFKILTKPEDSSSDDLRVLARDARQVRAEYLLSDMTARMICYPQFRCDTELLARTLKEVEASAEQQLIEVAELLGELDAEGAKTALSSSAKFAQALQAYGVEPPTKISKTTGRETFAFAKDDEGFTALLEHEDERVQRIASARLGAKSTLLETRLSKMMVCGDLMGGQMPVPLAYHAATTGRWGGRVWNPQNLPRIPRDKEGNIQPKPTNALRMALVAPPGHKVVVSDLSGIELRVNHYLWDVPSTRELYATDPEADLYKEFAAALFGVAKEAVTKPQRQLAKVAQLGLGFGAGANTFRKVAKTMGGIVLDEDEAKRVTDAWRMKYAEIVLGWKKCQEAIGAMLLASERDVDPRGLVTTGDKFLRLPSGRRLYYPNLHLTRDEEGKKQYRYGQGRKESKVYSGLLDENIVQSIARDVIAEQALTVRSLTGYSPALMVHDELVYVVPQEKAEAHLVTLNKVMRTTPQWLPGIVLWSEGDIAASYGEAK